MIVGVRGRLSKCDRRGYRRICVRYQDGCRRVVEEAGITEVVGQLPAELSSANNGVLDASGRKRIDEVCLVEDVQSGSRIIVGGKSNQSLVSIGSARNIVLIASIVAAEEGPVANVEPARLVFDGCRAKIDIGKDVTVIRIAIEGRDIDVGGPALERRNATIGHARIAQVFISEVILVVLVGSMVSVGATPNRRRLTPSRKLPESSNIPLSRKAILSLIG